MIPLFSPQRQNEALLSDIQRAFSEVLLSGEYILGRAVPRFEEELAAAAGYRCAVGCSSGTEALILALKALDLPPGSEVLTPAFSFVASASTILWAGHRPRFVDVDALTGCVTPEAVEAALTPATRAVIAVDLYGRQVDVPKLRALCDRKGLYLLEDGAQSIGVPNRGPHAYTTSFYPTKNVGAVGDAGAVMTDDPQLAAKIRRLSQHGAVARDHYDAIGTNARLDTLQAAVLRLKLPHLKTWTEGRRKLVAEYREALAPLAAAGKVVLPPEAEKPETHVWSLFTLRVPEGRSAVVEGLMVRQVGCGVYYSRSIPSQKALARYAEGQAFPGAERLAATALSLPLYPELTSGERQAVVTSLAECFTSSSISP